MTAIRTEQAPGGVLITVNIPTDAASHVGRALEQLELGAPGDTSVRVEGDAVVVSRFVAGEDRTRRHDAEAGVQKLASQIAALLGAADDVDRAVRDLGALPPPTFAGTPYEVGAISDRYWTVPSSQSAWATPDPATEPVAVLQPGAWLDLLTRTGDWARVRSEHGDVVFTDARTLVPANQGEQP